MRNFYYTLFLFQASIFVFFLTLERIYPNRSHSLQPNWLQLWLQVVLFALCWLQLVSYLWHYYSTDGLFSLDQYSLVGQVMIFYLVYSFGNYWFHRWKHANPWLWKYVHSLHHAPHHMDMMVTYFRHPFEIVLNTVYLILVGKVILNAPFTVLLLALMIEGALESFHHSNTRIPASFRWLGKFVQLPEMHCIHHQRGLHKFNYAPIIWDGVFNTACIPDSFQEKIGLKGRLYDHLICR